MTKTFTCEIGEGLKVDVFFDYTPGYPDDSEITSIEVNGIDIQDCLNIETMDQIENKMNRYINSDTFGAW